MINQIKKNSNDIQAFLTEIDSINLFTGPEANADGSLLQCKSTLNLWNQNVEMIWLNSEKIQAHQSINKRTRGPCIWNQ